MADAPRSPRNTTADPALVHLVGLMGGQNRYITEQEAQGQREVVHSDVLPAQAPWAELETLGFAAGEPVEGDPMFRRATLPEGWARQGSDHSMWSHIVDDRGIKRVSIFYKAAFYDRSAHASIARPGYSAASDAIYGDGEVVLPGEWSRFTDDERADAQEAVDQYLASAERHPDIYGDRLPRVRALIALMHPAATTEEAPRG